MNVLYALDTYKPVINGVAVSIERQARALVRWGHNANIIAPGPGWKKHEEWDNGIRVFRTRAMRLVHGHRLSMASKQDVELAFARAKPDLVVVVLPFPLSRAVLSVAHARGIPVVGISGTVPEWVLYNMRVLSPFWSYVRPLVWHVIVDHYNHCDRVVGVTPTALRFLQENGLNRPATAISNGVDLHQFFPRTRNLELANKLGVPQKPTVLYTGRLDKDKCMEVLIRAIPIVLSKVDAHFVLGGEGTDKARIRGLVHHLKIEGNVTFPGFLQEQEYPKIYSLADVFAISSPTELQSIVTLEAASSGLPIVAVNAGALPELVDSGESGFLFEPEDSCQMADMIVRCLQDDKLRGKMSKNSRAIAEKHDFTQAVRKYEALYQDILSQ